MELTTVSTIAQEIAHTINQAMADIGRAAEQYAQALDDHGDAIKNELLQIAPAVPALFWNRLEQIGRQQLDRRLLHGETPAARKLRRLPYSEQRAALDTGVELLTADGDTLLVQVDCMTPRQAKQVFAADHIRSLPEQRAWLEDAIAQTEPPQPYSEPFAVRRGKLEVHRAVTLTRSELARILAEMS